MPRPDRLLHALARRLPATELLTDPSKTAPYARDEAVRGTHAPLAVAFPRSTAEVRELLRFAQEEEVALIPRGAGSGLSGAAVPFGPAVVLSLERMNRILEVSGEDSVAVVEPGVITGEIRKAVEARGLFYPPIPASLDLCTIGGNVSTNAGGLCAVKYGVTREYVLGLEVVLPGGEAIETGGRFVKHSTGYNLTQLVAGSEGTLGVITKIVLRLIPLPQERLTLLAAFGSAEEVSRAVVSILAEGVVPPTLELLPKAAVARVLKRHPDLRFPFPEAPASLLVELDSRNAASIEADSEALQRVLAGAGASAIAAAATASQREEIWAVRKRVRDSVAGAGDYVEADSVVPRRNLPALVGAAGEVGRAAGLEVISYGHAGDGNLHTYFLRGALDDAAWKTTSETAIRDYIGRTVELEGTISGEHGIGVLRRPFLKMALEPAQIELMKRIKAAFDPKNLLNPGKVLPA